MSKMRVIDLLNKIANGEKIPKKIKVKDYIFIWKVLDNGTGYYNVKEDTGYYWLEDYVSLDNSEDLNTEIKITEEEPEIDIQSLEELRTEYTESRTDYDMRNYINRVILPAIKKLDNQINNK